MSENNPTIADIILEIKRHPAIVSEQKYNEWHVRLCDIMREHGENRAQAVRNGYEMDSTFCKSVNAELEAENRELKECLKEIISSQEIMDLLNDSVQSTETEYMNVAMRIENAKTKAKSLLKQ